MARLRRNCMARARHAEAGWGEHAETEWQQYFDVAWKEHGGELDRIILKVQEEIKATQKCPVETDGVVVERGGSIVTMTKSTTRNETRPVEARWRSAEEAEQ